MRLDHSVMVGKKKAILVVSFGTTYPDTREKNISAIRKQVERVYPDWMVAEALSSGIVRRAMKEIGRASCRERV